MSFTGRGRMREVREVNWAMVGRSSLVAGCWCLKLPTTRNPQLDKSPDIRDFAGEGGGGGGQRRDQKRAPTFALPALEVAVAGAHRVLPGFQFLGIHCYA